MRAERDAGKSMEKVSKYQIQVKNIRMTDKESESSENSNMKKDLGGDGQEDVV